MEYSEDSQTQKLEIDTWQHQQGRSVPLSGVKTVCELPWERAEPISSSRWAIHNDCWEEGSTQEGSLLLRQCWRTFSGASPEFLVICFLLPQTGGLIQLRIQISRSKLKSVCSGGRDDRGKVFIIQGAAHTDQSMSHISWTGEQGHTNGVASLTLASKH